MIRTLLSRIGETVARLKTLIAVVGLLYVASVGAGIVTGRLMPTAWPDNLAKAEQNKNEQIEKVFGRFREPVREGQWSAVLTASGLVFLINLFGDFSQFTVLSILIVPASFLGLAGWMQGMSLAQIHGSSFFSVFLYLFMGSLEWITYPLATVAGLNVGLSALFPKRQATTSRWLAFKQAWRDAGRLYLLIAMILAVQAVCEILYVRQVLLHGGSGVPLAPY
jgi:hypothetical protein